MIGIHTEYTPHYVDKPEPLIGSRLLLVTFSYERSYNGGKFVFITR